MNRYDYLDAIRNRMTAEDLRFYGDIWEPTEVAVPPADAWSNLCVTPGGELRIYGDYRKESVFQRNCRKCYLSSLDGGLSWKLHFSEKRFVLGASVPVPHLGKYIKIKDEGYSGIFALLGDSPDDENPMRILITDKPHVADVMTPFVMRSRNRVLVITHETRPALHPTAFFAVLHYADGDLRNWHTVPLSPAPFHAPQPGHTGVRWQQNSRENTVEERSDGTLVMMTRTATDYHYVYHSEDGGESWSEPEPSVFHSTGTMPHLKRLSDGRLLFFWSNTRPLPEREDADGIWEDVFTNRDAIHVAISEDDGKTWRGYRELALNPHRNAPDYRSLGGPEEGRDKSVHQVESLELPGGKMLVAYGQHSVCRRAVIFDLKWLYETDRHEDLLHGLRALSTQTYLQSILGCYRGTEEAPNAHVGHCAYNRVSSAYLVPSPADDGHEVLQIGRSSDPRLVSGVGGAVWNFPIARAGSVKVRLRVEGEGLRISLLDFWMNPSDEEVRRMASFSALVNAGIMHGDALFTELCLDFDCDANTVSISRDGKFLSRATMHGTHPNGLCYLHLQSAAAGEDLRGTLIASLDFQARS